MKLESYWLDTAPAFVGGAQGPVMGRADVVVIGAGFTGLSAALALARQGASVTVLEAGRVVGEASGRNGGHCNSGLAHDFASLAERIGVDKARRFYQAYDAAVDTVESVVARERIACDFVRAGKLKLAAKPEHYDKLARACEVLRREVDPHVEMVPRSRLQDEVRSSSFFGGLLQKTSAQMHMGKFGVGLAEAAVRNGARIYERAPVTKMERRADGTFRVTSPRGQIDAKQVLLATGNSGTGPFSFLRRRMISVGSFIIGTEPLDKALLDRLLPHRRAYTTSRHIGNYFRVSPDNRLLFGGRARFAMSNPRSDEKSGRILQAAMEATFPELRGVRIDYCWGGLVDMTADRLPRAGQHNGMYYSVGYSGHGVQMSVHMGQVMADVMAGRPECNPWRELDWPAIPGHFGKPWFLPIVGAYYRWQDWRH
ncbi:NAD(P)/FAD-dependent oxidoreductase [Cupriavidus consociatus]|uniref:NAD(P)/FAD-dependent oxidoreductase n=1 Tax=Cupriavidus consociatus TaxID=2821357 RepID=UPI001AE92E16|nr:MULTISPECIES: FAD-binding oxidoreductase [unclassified Cupriavidus]MBP0625329.1 FAD-binding oxidoreductase [Cupriavidus sp. LEh25]MDK2662066.1 FAD-binding oxidoreductase [Cupriavidus sp. LEh21]